MQFCMQLGKKVIVAFLYSRLSYCLDIHTCHASGTYFFKGIFRPLVTFTTQHETLIKVIGKIP